MKMEVFEYTIYAKKEEVAGANDLDFAKQIAYFTANTMHCDVDVINSFTGEIIFSLVCFAYTIWNTVKKTAKIHYEVKEREWD